MSTANEPNQCYQGLREQCQTGFKVSVRMEIAEIRTDISQALRNQMYIEIARVR